MPARGVGYYGTLVDRRPRIVQKGGRVRYRGAWYSHPDLVAHVGRQVMFDWGLGHLDGRYPVTECWQERIVGATYARRSGRKRQHRTVEGKFICYAEEDQP